MMENLGEWRVIRDKEARKRQLVINRAWRRLKAMPDSRFYRIVEVAGGYIGDPRRIDRRELIDAIFCAMARRREQRVAA